MNKYDDVKVYVHDGRLIINPHTIFAKDANNWIQDWQRQTIKTARKLNADHFIYATKHYKLIDDEEKLIKVNLYCDVALDENEFNNRVNNSIDIARKNGESIWFGCFHRGVAY